VKFIRFQLRVCSTGKCSNDLIAKKLQVMFLFLKMIASLCTSAIVNWALQPILISEGSSRNIKKINPTDSRSCFLRIE
jgi:hypothetical protein